MIKIRFVEDYDDKLLRFAIIIARSHGKWVLAKHKERDSYEFPAGHRKDGEDIKDTARRELYEETGAVDYRIEEVGVFTSLTLEDGIEKEAGFYSMVFYAEIRGFDEMPDFEMEEIGFFDELPDNLTYVDIQPRLVDIVIERGFIRD